MDILRLSDETPLYQTSIRVVDHYALEWLATMH
jgi:hypothetical protein